MKPPIAQQFFTSQLLLWNAQHNQRQMPWKGEKDPYKIWLSEIILQQTRVEQGLEYYNRFIAAFPIIDKLAAASETEVFKLWEGLGYYTRCKNLIATAQYVSLHLDGKFPNQYAAILQLKGIGPYTAAAISSFAFNLPHAVVDGNVFRVLARYFGIDTPIDSTAGRHLFTDIAQELLDKKNPANYNQAIMDFGAVICKPKLPLCSDCLLKKKCIAFQEGTIDQLPVKEKKIIKRSRWFYYLVLEHGDHLYARKRGPKDIWENLYEFSLIENEAAMPLDAILALPEVKALLAKNSAQTQHISPLYKQLLTHQTIYGQFIRLRLKKPLHSKSFAAFSLPEIAELPFPKFIDRYLKDKNVSLSLF